MKSILQVTVMVTIVVLFSQMFIGATPLTVIQDYQALQDRYELATRTNSNYSKVNTKLSNVVSIREGLQAVLQGAAVNSSPEDISGYSGKLIREIEGLTLLGFDYGYVDLEDGSKFKKTEDLSEFTHINVIVTSENASSIIRYVVLLEQLGFKYMELEYTSNVVEQKIKDDEGQSSSQYKVYYTVDMIIEVERGN